MKTHRDGSVILVCDGCWKPIEADPYREVLADGAEIDLCSGLSFDGCRALAIDRPGPRFNATAAPMTPFEKAQARFEAEQGIKARLPGYLSGGAASGAEYTQPPIRVRVDLSGSSEQATAAITEAEARIRELDVLAGQEVGS